MPFKVYTYEDPYRLNETSFWSDICSLPHFCVARTLVNGLKDIMKEDIHGLICPLDDFVNHLNVYHSWNKNISLRIQQYSVLTSLFSKMETEGLIDKPFHNALLQNQSHFLDALRLFIELGISPDSLDYSQGNKEQRLFVDILKIVSDESIFQLPSVSDNIKEIICDLANNELKEYKEKNKNRNNLPDEKWYQNAINVTMKQEIKEIVIHGVHQFSPTQLRLLLELDRLGISIIFLFNYQPKYSAIYSSWLDIYRCFEVPIEHDTRVRGYQSIAMQTPSNALACAIGELCEGKLNIGNQHFKKWNQLYKNIPFTQFANITEYAHYVSDHFDAAIEKYNNSLSVRERGNKEWNNAAVLQFMDEQVYTANRDVHTLLKIYYPEYAKDRHFLAYPIGQFFTAIYRLWDYKTQQIKIDISLLRECLSSNILQSGTGEELLRTFTHLEILFDSVTNYAQFTSVIATKYLENYRTIKAVKTKTDPLYSLRRLSIYNPYKVTEKDIRTLINAIDEINSIAYDFFSSKDRKDNYISFGNHFSQLEKFIQQRQLNLATEEEKRLISALQARLNEIQPEKSTFAGTFNDLQQGLYYYLKQKEDEQGVDWIVKNFEQIDGDILQTKGQFQKQQKKVYHFACLSDKDLNSKIDDLLPWPLTDNYIRHAYTPQDLQFQVYYSALSERSRFLRYALFYGLFYNRCDVSLSYVKQYGEEVTEPYALLSILGLSPDPTVQKPMSNAETFQISVPKTLASPQTFSSLELMDMFLCPYRFLLDYVLEEIPVVDGNFLYQKFYENLIIKSVWIKISGLPKATVLKSLSDTIDRESRKYHKYFEFWKAGEVHDMNKKAYNYIVNWAINNPSYAPGKDVAKYNELHMHIREQFGNARFDIDMSDYIPVNIYQEFEKLAEEYNDNKGSKKAYSLYKIVQTHGRPIGKSLNNATMDYLNQIRSADRSAISSDWCIYCAHREMCMESFLKDK